MDGEELVIMFGVLFGLAIVAWIFAAIAGAKRKADDAACPVCTKSARVVDRGTSQGSGITIYSAVPVVFELENGERIRFVVQESAAQCYVVGDTGTLKWQGKSIISFIRDK